MNRFVYADNAATTKVAPEVLDAMLPYFKEQYGNPSSLHQKGVEARIPLDAAREKIASLLGCKANEIYFTASGSESDTWAIKGSAYASRKKGKHIITTKIEHHAVLNAMKDLQKDGFDVTYLDVDKNGLLTAEDVAKAIRPDTILIEMMYANNEIGTILPIQEVATLARSYGITMFTDAVQAVGNIPVRVDDLGVDMLSFSGHKIHAPKGISTLYIKNGTRMQKLINGGEQERGKRGGTENVPYIIGLAKALELAVKRLPEMKRVQALRDALIAGIEKIPYSRINGDRIQRLPGNVNASFSFIEGESLLLSLDLAGICASTGSACSSASLEASHVLLAIGVPIEEAHGSLRLTISHETTEEDIAYILEKLTPIVERLRAMSPLYEERIS